MTTQRDIEDIIIKALHSSDMPDADVIRYEDPGVCAGYSGLVVEMKDGSKFLIKVMEG